MQGQTTLVLALGFLAFFCLTSGTTNVATRTALMEVERDNAELKRQYAEVKKEIAHLRRLLTGGLAGQARQSMTSYGRASAIYDSGGGATYIRWGRTSCPAESTLVYKGYAGGSFSEHRGGAANHLCLPEDPYYNTDILPWRYSEIWGVEYKVDNGIFPGDVFNEDVPCAVCRSPTRSSAIMIPARTSCYPGLHREYSGYLMAGHSYLPGRTEYICVDGDPETVPGGESDKNGNLLYFTVSRCGPLKCPPYNESLVLSCVVCSQ